MVWMKPFGELSEDCKDKVISAGLQHSFDFEEV